MHVLEMGELQGEGNLHSTMDRVFAFLGLGDDDFTVADVSVKNKCVRGTPHAAVLSGCGCSPRAFRMLWTLCCARRPLTLRILTRARRACACCRPRRHYPKLEETVSLECLARLRAFYAAHNAALARRYPHLASAIATWG